jgi:8-amino-7-oxononanoate synthase
MNEVWQPMFDFTSSLYLGLSHPSHSLRPWQQLTLGVPAALRTPPGTRRLESELARLQGCERVSLGTSTLHLFWDLFGMLSDQNYAIYFDQRTYPVARWGVERAFTRGTPAVPFRHLDCQSLRLQISRNDWSGRRPLILTDGFCTACGRDAPLVEYLEVAQAADGLVVIDDTQAIGILGHSPDAALPYGKGGGGSLRWRAISSPRVLMVNSLAKGFGVPMAMLGGSNGLVERFEARSETRVHTSPPSVATLRAAERALAINRSWGDILRRRVGALVGYFRSRLQQIGWSSTGGIFPVQGLLLQSVHGADALFEHLLNHGITTAPVKGENPGLPGRISIILTARHRQSEIDRLVEVLDDLPIEHGRGASIEQRRKFQLRAELDVQIRNCSASPNIPISAS